MDFKQALQKQWNTLTELKNSFDISGRNPTPDERRTGELLLDQIEELEERMGKLNISPGIVRPDVGFRGRPTEGQYFKSFGEQLQAVAHAGQPGQAVDKRLYEVSTRAASGMGETIPSDGGQL